MRATATTGGDLAMQIQIDPPVRALCGCVGVLLCVAIPGLAHAAALAPAEVRLAYIDPGSGSFILQALIAAVAGAAVAVNAYWEKIKRVLGFRSSKSEDEPTDPGANDGG
jgi:ethanolamine utilization microcompartment shell protein EutS